MKKLLVFVFTIVILFTGCGKKERIYLDDKYYGNNEFIEITSKDIKKDGSYLVFVYNDFCALKVPCDKIFKEFMDDNKISMYSLSFKEMQKTFISDTLEYGPSIVIISDGKVIDYLDAENDKHLDYYQDSKKLKKWLEKSIYLKK